eukprot:COSAG02_NODE_5000_length_4731_cov_1.894430_2_plen_440_part_00
MLLRLAVLLTVLVSALDFAPAATAAAASAATTSWLCYTQGVQTSPAMVSPNASIVVTFADGISQSAAKWEVTLRARNGTVLASKSGSGAGQATLPSLGCHACLATWEARFGAGPTSPKQVVFTPAHGWADGNLAPAGMWAPDNATKDGPQFALLKADLPAASNLDSAAEVESALFFATADAPARATGKPGGTRPILAGYKAWIGDMLIGMGPGRAKCGLVPSSGAQATSSPGLCPAGVERVFDGYDVTSAIAACRSSGCTVTIEGYGYDQPVSSTQTQPIYRRVAAELVLQYADGTSWSLTEASAKSSDGLWKAMDADPIYLENLWAIGGGGHAKNVLGSSGGGAWYYYPHEYIDLGRMPAGVPPLSPPGAAPGNWQPAVSKPAFRNLVVRNVPPVEVLPDVAAASVKQLGPGHFMFDMGREIQGVRHCPLPLSWFLLI